MVLNTSQLNTIRANHVNLSTPQPAATIITVEQIVGTIASGRVVRMSQIVEFYETATGSMITIEQVVSTTTSGQILAFLQNIVE